MDTMSRLRASFRSSTRRKKKKPREAEEEEDDDGLSVSLQEIELELRPRERFRPSELRVTFSVPDSFLEVTSQCPSPWEPSLKSSLKGVCVWVPPFGLRVPLSETQDAFFLLEDLRKSKRKALAKARISLKDFALSPPLRLKLKPLSRKILSATLNLSFNKSMLQLPLVDSLSLAEEEEDVSSNVVSSLENISDSTSRNNPSPLPNKKEQEQPSLATLSPPSLTSLNRTDPKKKDEQPRATLSPPSLNRKKEEQPRVPVPIFQRSGSSSEEEEEGSGRDLSLLPPPSLLSTNSQRDIPSPAIQRTRGEEEALLDWAKGLLQSSERIKITNLTSSWRNGIGYCALLHSRFPEFVPLHKLENHNQESNRKLASDLVGFLGGSPLSCEPTPSREDIVAFLKEIRKILSDDTSRGEEDLLRRWKEVCTLFREDESSSSPSVSKESSPEGELPSPSKNEKAKRLIQEAHANFGVTFRRNKGGGSPPVPPEVRQSVILLKKELLSLSEEEERIKNEKNELEKQFRAEASSSNGGAAQNKKLKRWIELVNERHSLVRRQMQLNIKEKESLINSKLETLRGQLREFEEISESLKTEEMRNEETALIEELVKTVNEKNELVHHLDNEEKAIDEDERIKKLLEEQTLSPNGLNNIKNLKIPGVGAEECVIQ